MAGVVFSKLSGKNDSLYKAVEGVLTEIITDVDTGKTDDDKVLEAVFNVKKSNKFGERVGGMTEFSNFAPVNEGGVAQLDELQEGYAKLVVHTQFMKSFNTTRQMVKDGEIDTMKIAAANFVKAYKRSKLEFATQFLTTEGTTFTFGGQTFDKTTGDGKGLFATDHTSKTGGADQSNVYTNELGNDSQMLMRLANLGRNFKNDSGHSMGYVFDTIMLPGNVWDMEDTARKIILSSNIVGSANNDINTQKNKWNLIVNHRWEAASGTKPYILLSSEANKELMGLVFYNREPLDVMNDVDINTRNLVWNGYTRFSAGCFNWRCAILGGATSGTTLT